MSPRTTYAVQIKRSAERDMDRLPPELFDRVAAAILALEENPRRRGCKKLSGADEYRMRVGAYRVLYIVCDEARTVEVVAVGHRREVYRLRGH